MSNYNYYQTNTRFTSQEKKTRNKFFRYSKKRSILAREMSFKTIKDYFESNKLDKSQKRNFWLITKLHDHWLKICGKILYPHLRVNSLNGTTLGLIAQSGIWLQEAKFLERELLKKIKEVIPNLNLTKIEIKVEWFLTSKTKIKNKSTFPTRVKAKTIEFKSKSNNSTTGKMSLRQKMDHLLNQVTD